MVQIPTNSELIALAQEVINPQLRGSYKIGHVGAALVTDNGTIFRGVALDASSGLGMCAEKAAISQMVAQGEYSINKIVSVWKDPDEERYYIMPPCGVCRQFMRFVLGKDKDAEIVVDKKLTTTLSDLLPQDWWADKVLIK